MGVPSRGRGKQGRGRRSKDGTHSRAPRLPYALSTVIVLGYLWGILTGAIVSISMSRAWQECDVVHVGSIVPQVRRRIIQKCVSGLSSRPIDSSKRRQAVTRAAEFIGTGATKKKTLTLRARAGRASGSRRRHDRQVVLA